MFVCGGAPQHENHRRSRQWTERTVSASWDKRLADARGSDQRRDRQRVVFIELARRDERDAVLGVHIHDTLIITRDLFQENRKFGLQALMGADPAIGGRAE